MIDPRAIIDFAALLASMDSEVAWRAAVSRAYYAAFHHLRSFAEERVGLPGFGTTDDHRDLSTALYLLEPDLARDFGRLRRWRNISDYELDSDISRDRVELSPAIARRLFNAS